MKIKGIGIRHSHEGLTLFFPNQDLAFDNLKITFFFLVRNGDAF